MRLLVLLSLQRARLACCSVNFQSVSMRVAFVARAALVFYRELQADANIAANRGRNIDAEERRRAKAEKEEYDRCNPQLQLCCCSMLLACASASASFLFDGAAAVRWQFCSGQRRRWSTSLKRCAMHCSSAQLHTWSSKPPPHISHLKAHSCNLQLQTTNPKTEEYNLRTSFPTCTQQVGNNALRCINVGYGSIYALQKEKHACYKSSTK